MLRDNWYINEVPSAILKFLFIMFFKHLNLLNIADFNKKKKYLYMPYKAVVDTMVFKANQICNE